MSDTGNMANRRSNSLIIDKVPHAALQALYHAVTGKTENLSKSLNKNVLVGFDDICQLHARIEQQLEHYVLVTSPNNHSNIKAF